MTDVQPEAQQAAPAQAQNFDPATGQPVNAAPAAAPADSKDGLAVLAYLGILIIVPMVTTPKSTYMRFHNRQGLCVITLYVINIALSILSGILAAFLPYNVRGFITGPIGLVTWALGVFTTICTIIGIVNAVQKKQKELPVIGKLIGDKLPANWG